MALVFPRGAHVFMCALTCDVCPFIYICIASPLGGEAGPWVCTSLHTLGSIAYTYACLLPALLRAAAFTCACALLSYPLSRMHPTHSCSPCTMGGSLAVGAGYPPLCKQRRLVLWVHVFSPEGHLFCTVILLSSSVVGLGCASLECGSTCLALPPCVSNRSTASNQVRARECRFNAFPGTCPCQAAVLAVCQVNEAGNRRGGHWSLPISDCAGQAAPWSEIHGTFLGGPLSKLDACSLHQVRWRLLLAICSHGAWKEICRWAGGGMRLRFRRCDFRRVPPLWRPWVISRLPCGTWVRVCAGNREDARVFPPVFSASGLPHCLLETSGAIS